MLIKLKQIQGGLELENDVKLLKERSYTEDITFECESFVDNTIQLPSKPIETRVIELEVNGISYCGDRSFIVDYERNTITWIHSGFEIDSHDHIVVHYSTLKQNNR